MASITIINEFMATSHIRGNLPSLMQSKLKKCNMEKSSEQSFSEDKNSGLLLPWDSKPLTLPYLSLRTHRFVTLLLDKVVLRMGTQNADRH